MFLKNKNIIFKIRRSKVTDYAALNEPAHGILVLNALSSKEGSGKPAQMCKLARAFSAHNDINNQWKEMKTQTITYL